MVFLWRDDISPVIINKELTTQPFELQAFGYDHCLSNTTSGEYSCLEVQLSFGRSALEQYLVQAYLPVAALVVVAYLTLWVPERRGPRLICALSAFAVTALAAAVVTTLDPSTNDATALDCWAKWCVLFAFVPIIAILVTGCGQVREIFLCFSEKSTNAPIALNLRISEGPNFDVFSNNMSYFW